MPFSMSFSTIPGASVAGPCVQMIFVFLLIMLHPPSNKILEASAPYSVILLYYDFLEAASPKGAADS